ncbi:MAG: ABC transporter permease [Tepidiformaceae bacterium]
MAGPAHPIRGWQVMASEQSVANPPAIAPPRPGVWTRRGRSALRTARRQPLGVLGLLLVIVFILMAAVPNFIAPYPPNKIGVGLRLEDPSFSHLMGTDSIGRDVFSRIVYGARISVLIGFGAVAVGTAIGTVIGLLTGFFGGWTDTLIQRLIDVMMTVPGLILALVIITIWGQGVSQLILTIGVLIMPGTARIVRASVLSEKNNQYVEAAHVLGASNTRIMFRHLLPNVSASIIVIMSVMVGVAILVEAALSFLGLGIRPPTASWGQMLSIDGRTYMLQQPWLAIWPGLAISIIVLSLNLLGDSLRDITDPKLRMR